MNRKYVELVFLIVYLNNVLQSRESLNQPCLEGESKKGLLRDSTMSGLMNSVPRPTEMLPPIWITSNTGEYHTIRLLLK